MSNLPHPIDAIKFRMEQYGHNQRQAAITMNYPASHLSEILSGKRKLTLGWVRRLHKYGVPLKVLVQEYV